MSTQVDLESIKTQIEYYFLPASISRDQFLISQMNSARYVDVSVISAFPKLMAMTSDIEVIKSAIRLSDSVELDSTGTKVRGKAFARTSLLLRDVAANTTVEELTTFVSGIVSKDTIVKVRPDISNVWYIDFINEASCVDAFNRLLGQMFNGNAIRCTIKTMPVLVNNVVNTADKGARAGALAPGKPQSVKYFREQMAKIVEKMSKHTYDAPESFIAYQATSGNTDAVPILRSTAIKTTNLLEPIPIMYPASPSPDMAMSAPTNIPPFFDLSSGSAPTAALGGSTSLGGLSDLSSLGNALSFTSSFITSNNNNQQAQAHGQQKKKTNNNPTNNNPNNTNNQRARTNQNNNNNNRNNNNNGVKNNNNQKKNTHNNNNNAPVHKKKVYHGPLALGIKSTSSVPVSTMNFASIVATQASEQAIAKAQETAQRNLAMRQTTTNVAVKKDEENQQTPTAATSGATSGDESKDANKQKKKKSTNKAKKEKDGNAEVQAVTPATPVSNRWSDLLKPNAN